MSNLEPLLNKLFCWLIDALTSTSSINIFCFIKLLEIVLFCATFSHKIIENTNYKKSIALKCFEKIKLLTSN